MSARKRVSKEPKRRVVTLTLPEDMLGVLDALGEEVNENRSAVVEAILEYGLQEEHLDEIFPYEEEGDEEET